MLYTLNVPLLIKGDRVAKGSEAELSAEEAAHFDPADITPAGGVPVAEAEAEEVVALEDMSHAQLKARAKELGLSAAGSIADLRERIALHLAGTATDDAQSEEGETEEAATDDAQSEEGEITSV